MLGALDGARGQSAALCWWSWNDQIPVRPSVTAGLRAVFRPHAWDQGTDQGSCPTARLPLHPTAFFSIRLKFGTFSVPLGAPCPERRSLQTLHVQAAVRAAPSGGSSTPRARCSGQPAS